MVRSRWSLELEEYIPDDHEQTVVVTAENILACSTSLHDSLSSAESPVTQSRAQKSRLLEVKYNVQWQVLLKDLRRDERTRRLDSPVFEALKGLFVGYGRVHVDFWIVTVGREVRVMEGVGEK